MWWQLHNLTEMIKRRNTLKLCKRCSLLHKKQLTECPKCTGVDDDKLEALLQQRSDSRVGIGNAMLYGAAAFVILIIILNAIV